MIQSFDDIGTEDIFKGQSSRHASKTLPVSLHGVAKRKLQSLDFSIRLEDLRVPPGNRLESLHGDLKGFFSIRINERWRIIFNWLENGPAHVKICDYH